MYQIGPFFFCYRVPIYQIPSKYGMPSRFPAACTYLRGACTNQKHFVLARDHGSEEGRIERESRSMNGSTVDRHTSILDPLPSTFPLACMEKPYPALPPDHQRAGRQASSRPTCQPGLEKDRARAFSTSGRHACEGPELKGKNKRNAAEVFSHEQHKLLNIL